MKRRRNKTDLDEIITEVIAWIGLIAILTVLTITIYSCSLSIQVQKGNNNPIMTDTQTERVDASDDSIDLLGKKRKKDGAKKDNKTKNINNIDSTATDSISGSK